jgi:hypothetical protein
LNLAVQHKGVDTPSRQANAGRPAFAAVGIITLLVLASIAIYVLLSAR